jgi:hypothetical protein
MQGSTATGRQTCSALQRHHLLPRPHRHRPGPLRPARPAPRPALWARPRAPAPAPAPALRPPSRAAAAATLPAAAHAARATDGCAAPRASAAASLVRREAAAGTGRALNLRPALRSWRSCDLPPPTPPPPRCRLLRHDGQPLWHGLPGGLWRVRCQPSCCRLTLAFAAPRQPQPVACCAAAAVATRGAAAAARGAAAAAPSRPQDAAGWPHRVGLLPELVGAVGVDGCCARPGTHAQVSLQRSGGDDRSAACVRRGVRTS